MSFKLKNFEVIKESDGFHIVVNNGCTSSDAIDMLWFNPNPFNSFIHAVRYLKENVEELI